MTAGLAWVLGGGGLLGSQVVRLLPEELEGSTCWSPAAPPYRWTEPDRLEAELLSAARRFAMAVRERGSPWLALWCAGAGGVGTAPEVLDRETAALETWLGCLGRELGVGPRPAPGVFLLCSSAGGVSGGVGSLPITEQSECSAISEYGRNKRRQEQLVLDWITRTPVVSCLIARISNLYGSGQALSRSQGLIGHISQHLVHRRPINIFVPLDTLRDYLHAEDAARYILRCLGRFLERLDPPSSVVKIVAAENSISIAGVIGVFSRIAKRPVRIVSMPSTIRSEQPDRLSFRSRVWTDLAPIQVELAAGLRSVYQHHLTLFQRGVLPAPPER
jgi:UDP-glucose 4-epimerase